MHSKILVNIFDFSLNISNIYRYNSGGNDLGVSKTAKLGSIDDRTCGFWL